MTFRRTSSFEVLSSDHLFHLSSLFSPSLLLSLLLKSHSTRMCQRGLSFKISGEQDGRRGKESEEFMVCFSSWQREAAATVTPAWNYPAFFPIPFRPPCCAQPGSLFHTFPLSDKRDRKRYQNDNDSENATLIPQRFLTILMSPAEHEVFGCLTSRTKRYLFYYNELNRSWLTSDILHTIKKNSGHFYYGHCT